MAITSVGGPGNGLQQYEKVFTTSTTWTKPNGVKAVEVTVIGGSGGGTMTGAGGCVTTTLDVSKVTSIPVVVGSGGAATPGNGGTSSFGSTDGSATTGYAIAYGSGANNASTGATRVGSAATSADTSLSDGFFTNPWFGSVTYTTTTSTLSASSTWAKINLINSRYFATGNGSTFSTSTDGASWTSATLATPIAAGNRISYGNGYYVYCIGNTSTTAGTNDSLYYSTNGTTWTVKTVTLGGPNLSVAYGPAGWIASSAQGTLLSKPATTNNPSTTWSSYTPTSGWSSSTSYIVGTSTRYYAFYTSSSGTAFRHSTDGSTWTLASTLTGNVGSLGSATQTVAVYNDTVYYIDSVGVLGKIVGTTPSVVDNSATWSKILDNGKVISSNGSAVYDIATGNVNPSTGVAATTIKWMDTSLYWTIPASSSSTITIYTISSATSNSYTDFVGLTQPYATGRASAGAMGTGTFSKDGSSVMGYPGQGFESWAWGASAYYDFNTPTTTYYYRSTYGSGVAAATAVAGNQGVVRVRWWA